MPGEPGDLGAALERPFRERVPSYETFASPALARPARSRRRPSPGRGGAEARSLARGSRNRSRRRKPDRRSDLPIPRAARRGARRHQRSDRRLDAHGSWASPGRHRCSSSERARQPARGRRRAKSEQLSLSHPRLEGDQPQRPVGHAVQVFESRGSTFGDGPFRGSHGPRFPDCPFRDCLVRGGFGWGPDAHYRPTNPRACRDLA
jgi:hypothetical protein